MEFIENKDAYGITAGDKERAKLFMLWLAIAAMIILFAGFSSYVIARQADPDWFAFDVPVQFTQSTIVIVVSSITMIVASILTRKGNRWVSTLFIFSTLILGIIFTYLQWEGWKTLVKNDIFFVDSRTSNISGSLFYVLTGLHLAHLLGGLIALFVTTIRSATGKYSPKSHTGVKLCAMYWHFLGGLWLYLFLFWNFSNKLF